MLCLCDCSLQQMDYWKNLDVAPFCNSQLSCGAGAAAPVAVADEHSHRAQLRGRVCGHSGRRIVHVYLAFADTAAYLRQQGRRKLRRALADCCGISRRVLRGTLLILWNIARTQNNKYNKNALVKRATHTVWGFQKTTSRRDWLKSATSQTVATVFFLAFPWRLARTSLRTLKSEGLLGEVFPQAVLDSSCLPPVSMTTSPSGWPPTSGVFSSLIMSLTSHDDWRSVMLLRRESSFRPSMFAGLKTLFKTASSCPRTSFPLFVKGESQELARHCCSAEPRWKKVRHVSTCVKGRGGVIHKGRGGVIHMHVCMYTCTCMCTYTYMNTHHTKS